MKKVTLITSFALLVLLCFGCANDSKKIEEKQPASEQTTAAPAKKTNIMKEWLVEEAFKGLPEKNCLRYTSYEDSTNVTIMFVDTCTDNTSILYTTILGGETMSFDRKYPNGKRLTLVFSYQADEFSVLGSKIVTKSDSTLLDQKAIAKIVQQGYKI
jgi:hypothetical protein